MSIMLTNQSIPLPLVSQTKSHKDLIPVLQFAPLKSGLSFSKDLEQE